MSVELGDVSVAQLVESLSLGVSHWRSERPDVQMVVQVDPGLHAIRSDRHRVEQILVNFLSNAFKHTTRGEVRLSFAFESATTVRIAVQDTGKGIDTEMQQRLFQKFSQGSHADSTTLKGYGLGLYLSKMLAKLLGAEIGCTSTLGVGSTFWLLVPAGSNARSLPREFEDTAVPLTKE
jgi:signal transduction histidine kinase